METRDVIPPLKVERAGVWGGSKKKSLKIIISVTAEGIYKRNSCCCKPCACPKYCLERSMHIGKQQCPQREVSIFRTVHKSQTHQVAESQQRGAKGYFTGSRLEFLNSYCDEYVSLSRKNRHQFWLDLFSTWWEKYPWHLEDHKEPLTDLKKMEELVHVGPDTELKRAVEDKLRAVSLLCQGCLTW